MITPDGFSCESAGGIWQVVSPLLKEDLEGHVHGFEDLVRAAREAKRRAYAPYSLFQVGSVVVMDGVIFPGANVENASSGASLCAERNAITTAVAAGHRRLEVIVVSSGAPPGATIDQRSPCGICRQVISEFAGPNTLVVLDAGDAVDGRIQGEVIAFESLLPWRFRLG